MNTRDLVSYVPAHAVHLDPANIATEDVEILSGLDAELDGKRFAFVGESNHFVHEKYAYRVLMARYLNSRGWRIFGEELSWTDGLRVSCYLETGDGTWLDRVTAYGYRGDERVDRDDTPTGILGEGWGQTDPAFVAEQRRWADFLRTLDVRFFGFDIDYVPSSGYANVLERLERSGDADALSAFKRVPGESIEDEHRRLTDAFERLDAHIDGELIRAAATLRDSHKYAASAYKATTYEALREPMALREIVMHEHLDHVIAREGPHSKIALFSHNLHLARDDSATADLAGGVGPGGNRVDSIGTYLSKRYPGEVFTVWMLESEGQHSSPMKSLGHEVRSPAGSLNAELARCGHDVFIVPARSRDGTPSPFDDAWEVSMMHGSRTRVRVADQTDAIFYQRRVTPLQA
jgi:erythromycin esterase-like protein